MLLNQHLHRESSEYIISKILKKKKVQAILQQVRSMQVNTYVCTIIIVIHENESDSDV